jgi:hypothetical protein
MERALGVQFILANGRSVHSSHCCCKLRRMTGQKTVETEIGECLDLMNTSKYPGDVDIYLNMGACSIRICNIGQCCYVFSN